MKNDQYFPLEVNMTSDERVAHLIEELGVKGFGIYVLLLIEIRRNDQYLCGKSALKTFSRANRISNKVLEDIINNYNLFEWKKDGELAAVSSVYMERVMSWLENKRQKLSDAAKKGIDKKKRNKDGMFTSQAGAVQNSTEQNSTEKTTATAVVVTDSSSSSLKPLKNWEEILLDLRQDKVWMEKLAMHSCLGGLFLKYEATIVEAFRQHISLYGTGYEIQSKRDMCSYFTNFLRPGTPTNKRLTDQLKAMQKKDGVQNIHEFIDPGTGERSYFGHTIPPDAPPRPNANAFWDNNRKKWI